MSDAAAPGPPAASTTAQAAALMELRFELTVDDLADGSLAVARRARSVRTVQSGVLVAVTAWLLVVSLLTGAGGAAAMTGAMAMVGFLFFQASARARTVSSRRAATADAVTGPARRRA